MKNHHRLSIPTFCLLACLLPFPLSGLAGTPAGPGPERGTKALNLQSIAITGFNQVLGAPAAKLRFLGELNFPVGGVFNPDGPPLPIDNATPPDALLASYAAPEVYFNLFGIPDAAAIPNQNLRLADFPQLLSLDGQEGPLPQLKENPRWWERGNGAQIEGYTVADWLEARGRLKFVCSPGQNDYYELRLSNLVPGGLYTVWAVFFDQQEGLVTDIPLGGTSANVFSADRRGRAHLNQALNFCPPNIMPEARYQLVAVTILFQADGRVYAGVAHTVGVAPFNGPGMVTSPQLMFALPEADDERFLRGSVQP